MEEIDNMEEKIKVIMQELLAVEQKELNPSSIVNGGITLKKDFGLFCYSI